MTWVALLTSWCCVAPTAQDEAAWLYTAARSDVGLLRLLPSLGHRWQPEADLFVATLRNPGSSSPIPLLARLLKEQAVNWPDVLEEADQLDLCPVLEAWLQERARKALEPGGQVGSGG